MPSRRSTKTTIRRCWLPGRVHRREENKEDEDRQQKSLVTRKVAFS